MSCCIFPLKKYISFSPFFHFLSFCFAFFNFFLFASVLWMMGERWCSLSFSLAFPGRIIQSFNKLFLIYSPPPTEQYHHSFFSWRSRSRNNWLINFLCNWHAAPKAHILRLSESIHDWVELLQSNGEWKRKPRERETKLKRGKQKNKICHNWLVSTKER